jgi:hypothetical protein
MGRPPTPGPTPGPSPAVGTLDALAPIGGDIRIASSGVQNALAPAGGMPATSARMAAPSPMSPDADPAWLAYAQADPKGAMEARKTETEWQSERLKLNKAGLEEHQAVNSTAIQLLNGVTDQASYDRARADSARLYDQYGYEHPELPAEYHPELVNALRHRALEIKDDIAADLNERKQQWQQLTILPSETLAEFTPSLASRPAVALTLTRRVWLNSHRSTFSPRCFRCMIASCPRCIGRCGRSEPDRQRTRRTVTNG